MLFHSPEFIALMLVTLCLYAFLPRIRIPLLAVANAVFYGASGWTYLLLFIGMSAITYLCALHAQSRLVLWLGIGANLFNLGLFKYLGFGISNLNRLFDLGLDPAIWSLLLPIGISFYTFQLIAYLVDVHRGEIEPSRSPLHFWVFIGFFAQLIAGPIMRGREFLPQIEETDAKRLRFNQFKLGVFLFLLGMAKKILLSDTVGQHADIFFASWQTLNGLESWIAGWLFAFQIYFDFSAYSEMALGVGHMFGYDLAVNFRTPYLSRNPEEFWRRWHITLSAWIRDYIYIPLGGSRKGQVLAYANLLIAMTLSGLWHGAAWTFVAWGILHGALSAFHKLWSRYVLKPLGWNLDTVTVRWLSVFLMFQATTVGWIFFRAVNVGQALTLLRRMFDPTFYHVTPLVMRFLPLIAFLALLHVAEFWLRHREQAIYAAWETWLPRPVRALAYTALVAILLVMMRVEETSFIYFRF